MTRYVFLTLSLLLITIPVLADPLPSAVAAKQLRDSQQKLRTELEQAISKEAEMEKSLLDLQKAISAQKEVVRLAQEKETEASQSAAKAEAAASQDIKNWTASIEASKNLLGQVDSSVTVVTPKEADSLPVTQRPNIVVPPLVTPHDPTENTHTVPLNKPKNQPNIIPIPDSSQREPQPAKPDLPPAPVAKQEVPRVRATPFVMNKAPMEDDKVPKSNAPESKPTSLPATLVIHVDKGDKVKLEDVMMSGTGETRTFTTPPLKIPGTYTYSVKVISSSGETREKHVDMIPGETTDVDFN